MLISGWRRLAVIGLIVLAAAPALAQGVSARPPSGGLFGETRSDAGKRDALTGVMTISEGQDSDLPSEFRGELPGQAANTIATGGYSTMLVGALDYARNRRRVQLSANALTSFRYYRRLDDVSPVSHVASLGAGFSLPKQGRLQITQTAAYSPSYLYRLFPTAAPQDPGEGVQTSPDFRLLRTDSYAYDTRMALSFGSQLGTRVTTTAEYGLTDFRHESLARPDRTIYTAGSTLSHALSRAGGVSIGYLYRSSDLNARGTTNEHRLTMGLVYSPALSVSRRLIFHVNVSPTLLQIPRLAAPAAAAAPDDTGGVPDDTGLEAPAASQGRQQRLRVQGEASVDYPFGLKWRTTARYLRDVSYLAVLDEPVYTNGVRVELAGMFGRRVDVSVLAGYATGLSTFSRNNRDLVTYSGDAKIRFALSRNLAMYSEYLYYYYDFGGQAGLAPDLPRVYEQRGIRVGITLFARALGR